MIQLRFGVQVLHSVTIEGLRPGALYAYRCGGFGAWSDLYTFVARRSRKELQKDVTRLLLFGDMGLDNSQVTKS